MVYQLQSAAPLMCACVQIKGQIRLGHLITDVATRWCNTVDLQEQKLAIAHLSAAGLWMLMFFSSFVCFPLIVPSVIATAAPACFSTGKLLFFSFSYFSPDYCATFLPNNNNVSYTWRCTRLACNRAFMQASQWIVTLKSTLTIKKTCKWFI